MKIADDSVARRTLALEEHYLDPQIAAYFKDRGAVASNRDAMLEDFAGHRLTQMDSCGIDVQVLSHAPPGLQCVDASDAVDLARAANDRLARIVRSNPTRFAAFASLPTTLPEAAADELERACRLLHFKGAMIHGLTEGQFLDHPKFRPIFARAEALDVPIYLHPADPHAKVSEIYFADYAGSHPNFSRAAWGFTIETGTQALRLVLSGLFDEYPKLQIILGHLGEAIPFLINRIDEALARDSAMKTFRAYFTRHFHVTTSGFFSDPALLCCVQELGIDRIMFSVDWPYASNEAATGWFDRVSLSEADKHKIRFANAAKLLKI